MVLFKVSLFLILEEKCFTTGDKFSYNSTVLAIHIVFDQANSFNVPSLLWAAH